MIPRIVLLLRLQVFCVVFFPNLALPTVASWKCRVPFRALWGILTPQNVDKMWLQPILWMWSQNGKWIAIAIYQYSADTPWGSLHSQEAAIGRGKFEKSHMSPGVIQSWGLHCCLSPFPLLHQGQSLSNWWFMTHLYEKHCSKMKLWPHLNSVSTKSTFNMVFPDEKEYINWTMIFWFVFPILWDVNECWICTNESKDSVWTCVGHFCFQHLSNCLIVAHEWLNNV